jgi:hypothetical protein
VDEGADAGIFDAAARTGVPVPFSGWRGEAWRRTLDVLIFFFEGLGALSFTFTRRTLRF